jgi:dihydrofolate reductase
MRKLVESTFMTLDGVISDPHIWGQPYWDDEHDAYGEKLLEPAESLLLGRATYEAFAEAWPPRGDDLKINTMPKHVASRTLTEAKWNAEIIEGDVAEAVASLKDDDGGDILKYGTGELDHTLVENDLVDEFHFWVFPIIAGSGQRVLEGFAQTDLALLDINRFESGIVVHVLGPK